MDEEQVGDVGEPPQGILVPIGDRLVGEVRARHHERRLGVGAQQVVKRGVGNHHAELRRARRDLLRHGCPLAAAGDHHRSAGTGEERLLAGGQLDERAGGLEVGRHERERLGVAMLSLAKRPDDLRKVRATCEVIAAESLEGHDPPGPQRLGRGGHGISRRAEGSRAARPVQEAGSGTALGAGVRLGVEATVAGVLVLPPALRTHLEMDHGGSRPVVGQAPGDREPRAAVGAVDERVPVAAIAGIEQLPDAVITGRRVGRKSRFGPARRSAREDAKPALPARCQRLDRQVVHSSEWRRRVREPREQLVHPARFSLRLEQRTGRLVEHVTPEPEFLGQPVDEGTKADSLDRPGHVDAHSACCHLA